MLSSKPKCRGSVRGLLYCFLLVALMSVGSCSSDRGLRVREEQEVQETGEEGVGTLVAPASSTQDSASEEDEEEEEEESGGRRRSWEDVATFEPSSVSPEDNFRDLCNRPLPPENGYIKGDNYSYEAVVEVGCEAGYTLSGPSHLTCLPVSYPGAPGIWVPQDEYHCLRASGIENLQLSSSETFEEKTFDDNGSPYSDDIQHLREDHTDRRASFEHIHCSEPVAPENGAVIGTDYTMGATVTYACDAGYILIGPSQATCLAVPDPFHHRAIWDPPTLPSCQLAPAPPCLLPLSQQTEEPGFDSRQQASAHRLSDTASNADEVEGLPTRCSLPVVVGPCKAMIPRYYFDTADMECRPFDYGGCLGNDNNFETFDACQRACQ
ncbi:uncharacterized protein LOC143298925 [Babylonia areolata]|uniref:uncharacterized protein LOC143298925 n=1 Tax=Babylonia areolata TaxID=304850 RepID=UPI003FD4B018